MGVWGYGGMGLGVLEHLFIDGKLFRKQSAILC